MLREDPFVKEQYPHLVATQEEIDVFLEACKEKNVDLLKCGYGWSSNEREWLEATAVRMLWQ